MSSSEPAGYELPVRLLAAFRTVIDDLHAGLATVGHPDARPVHAFALQALGPDGASASELARRLGVSKQAAAKHVQALERLGYVERVDDPADARSRMVRPTARGGDLITASADIFQALRARWVEQLGETSLARLLDSLAALASTDSLRTDVLGWLGT
ncbi:MarR family winged helix-turn-helix transcriptional regulator [Frankia sp. Cppng1_Ct_nod]|uniref:MarR family winged helix-turn-helix transcriptional regulator n=1 Tax=Frankia sp. Cppng1_Ct_nod TaxID=2897162 RepID=UPI001041433D|nr:MarR family winged helix-turn-helix transcriptional regulator [Frankia sp. Cppng1_Ct_nod]